MPTNPTPLSNSNGPPSSVRELRKARGCGGVNFVRTVRPAADNLPLVLRVQVEDNFELLARPAEDLPAEAFTAPVGATMQSLPGRRVGEDRVHAFGRVLVHHDLEFLPVLRADRHRRLVGPMKGRVGLHRAKEAFSPRAHHIICLRGVHPCLLAAGSDQGHRDVTVEHTEPETHCRAGLARHQPAPALGGGVGAHGGHGGVRGVGLSGVDLLQHVTIAREAELLLALGADLDLCLPHGGLERVSVHGPALPPRPGAGHAVPVPGKSAEVHAREQLLRGLPGDSLPALATVGPREGDAVEHALRHVICVAIYLPAPVLPLVVRPSNACHLVSLCRHGVDGQVWVQVQHDPELLTPGLTQPDNALVHAVVLRWLHLLVPLPLAPRTHAVNPQTSRVQHVRVLWAAVLVATFVAIAAILVLGKLVADGRAMVLAHKRGGPRDGNAAEPAHGARAPGTRHGDEVQLV
mmetsp:Transcript_86353/g.239458  ORF Transcript_86353/g.239458 Transcript_86353/m.239458 type:complete len:463 (-) Transcript_86353:587-1975(-)